MERIEKINRKTVKSEKPKDVTLQPVCMDLTIVRMYGYCEDSEIINYLILHLADYLSEDIMQ